MGRKPVKQVPSRRPTWLWAALGAVMIVAIGVGAFWWLSEARDANDGTPRLVLDREVIDLGQLAFQTPAAAAFTLTNAGDGTLRLGGVPRVTALKGC